MAEMYIIEVPATERCEARYHLATSEREARKFCESFNHYHSDSGEPKIMKGGFGLLSMLLRAQAEGAAS